MSPENDAIPGGIDAPPLYPESIAPESRDLIRALARRPWSEEFYLAGSAALALHLGHRPVRDLDLMTGTNRLSGPERRDLLGDLLALDPGTLVETARDGYLYVRVPAAGSNASDRGTALRLFYYPYPLADPFEELDGLALASRIDLGLMKLGAIISRGSRRDFVDLYLLCRTGPLPLDVLLGRAADKFGHVRDFPLQALKGLADLSFIEGEPMPPLAGVSQALTWAEVESWLREEVPRLGRAHVGLAP